MIAIGAAIALILLIALASVRLFVGPTLYDRALAAHAVALLAALACAAVAVSSREPLWLDTAIALVAADFVLAAAVLKFFRLHSFQPPAIRERAE